MKRITLLSLFIALISNDFAYAQRPVATEELAQARELGRYTNEIVDLIINRMSLVSLDTQVQSMLQNGTTSKKFEVGFNTEGALVYFHDFDKLLDHQILMDLGGRKTGIQIVSFDLKMLANGAYHYSFSMGAYRNGSELLFEPQARSKFFAKHLDRVDFITATRDHRLSYSNIDSYEFRGIDIDLIFPLMSRKFALGALAGAGLGNSGHIEIDGLEQYGYENDVDSGFAKNFLGVGTPLNLSGGGGLRAGFKFLLNGQENGRRLEIRSIFEHSNANVILLKPLGDPSQNTYWPYEAKDFSLERSYLRGMIDYSVLNPRAARPTRIGVSLQLNIPLKDELSTVHEHSWDLPSLKVMDFTQTVNRLNLKVYVKF